MQHFMYISRLPALNKAIQQLSALISSGSWKLQGFNSVSDAGRLLHGDVDLATIYQRAAQ